ncbi:MAG: class I SAM-dependent methyltransferase [Planctomycetota bacterium]
MEMKLDAEVSRFTAALKQIESRIKSSSLSPVDALSDLTKAIRESSAACAAITFAESDETKAAKIAFREAIAPWFSQSWYMNRALRKPRGYPGDYEILEGIYDEKPKSRGIGEALDLYFLQTALARAVRGRKNWIRDFFPDFLSSHHTTPRVLDIACGPCREIREFVSRNGKAPFMFHGLDFDDEALSYAKSALTSAGFPTDNLSLVKQNVLRLASASRNVKTYGKFDLIYSVGLYDYLADDALIRILAGSAEMLTPQGRYLVAFKDSSRYDCAEYQWHVDWYFYQRTEAECRNLLEKSRLQIVSMEREPSGVVMMFTTTAKADK